MNKWTKILARHKAIMFHGMSRSRHPEDWNLEEALENIKMVTAIEKLCCSTIQVGDKRDLPRHIVNYWSSFGLVIKPYELMYASQEDVGSMSLEEFPIQYQYFTAMGIGPENFENSIRNRRGDSLNEFGVTEWKICGWFLDFNATTTLSSDLGFSNAAEIFDYLDKYGLPLFLWKEDILRIKVRSNYEVHPLERFYSDF